MADLLQDFETYFISMGLVTASSFFKDTMLDLPDSAVAVYEYAGSAGLPQIASSTRSIQIVTRDLSAQAARSKAYGLYKALEVDDAIIQLTPERWCLLIPRQTPFRFKVDARQRVYYAFNVGVTTYDD